MTLLTVFLQMLSLVIMVAAGWIAAQKNMIDQHTSGKLSQLILHIFNPLLALSNAIGAVGKVGPSQLAVVGLVAAGMFAVFIAVGMLLTPLFDRDPFQRKIFQLMFVFSNLGFIGIPVVNCVLGPEYVVYVTVFTLVYNVIFYTYGMALLDGKFTLASLRTLVTPANLIVIASLFVVIFQIHLPEFLVTAVTYLGGVASPVALMTVGYTLANSNLRRIFADARLYVFSLIKLLLLPLAMLPLLRLLPLEADVVPVCLVMFGMPIGNMPLILGTEKGIDCTTCSAGIIMTTVLCVFTVPVLVALV